MIIISFFYFVFGNHGNQIVPNIHLVFTLQAEVSFLHGSRGLQELHGLFTLPK